MQQKHTCLIAALSPNRGRDSNQAVTSFIPQLYRFRHVFSSIRVCPTDLPQMAVLSQYIFTTKYNYHVPEAG
jgi:hypothetical protein